MTPYETVNVMEFWCRIRMRSRLLIKGFEAEYKLYGKGHVHRKNLDLI